MVSVAAVTPPASPTAATAAAPAADSAVHGGVGALGAVVGGGGGGVGGEVLGPALAAADAFYGTVLRKENKKKHTVKKKVEVFSRRISNYPN